MNLMRYETYIERILQMSIVYQSPNYSPEKITGKYVACYGKKPNYVFRIFETCSNSKGVAGFGPALREYDCDGSELPEHLREKLILTKKTLLWL